MRAAALVLLSVAACGPVSVAEAERNCARVQGSTTGLTGLGRVGYASPGGLRGSLEIDLNTRSETGRDLSAEYAACVYRQSGELPRRPLPAN